MDPVAVGGRVGLHDRGTQGAHGRLRAAGHIAQAVADLAVGLIAGRRDHERTTRCGHGRGSGGTRHRRDDEGE